MVSSRVHSIARYRAIFRANCTSCAPSGINLARDGAAITRARALCISLQHSVSNYCIVFNKCWLFIISHASLFILSIRKRRMDVIKLSYITYGWCRKRSFQRFSRILSRLFIFKQSVRVIWRRSLSLVVNYTHVSETAINHHIGG